MTRKIAQPQLNATAVKDENGQYLPFKVNTPSGEEKEPPSSSPVDLSVDNLLEKGLYAVSRALKTTMQNISSGSMAREDIQNLKDIMVMLHELKKHEGDALDKLNEEQLEDYIDRKEGRK